MWSWAHYVESRKLVCFSISQLRTLGYVQQVMAVYYNVSQMGPICVIVTALRVTHVFSHCATSIGGVGVSAQCIHGQMSDCACAQCYQEWNVIYIIGTRLQSVAHYFTVQYHAFDRCAGVVFTFTTVAYTQRLHPASRLPLSLGARAQIRPWWCAPAKVFRNHLPTEAQDSLVLRTRL